MHCRLAPLLGRDRHALCSVTWVALLTAISVSWAATGAVCSWCYHDTNNCMLATTANQCDSPLGAGKPPMPQQLRPLPCLCAHAMRPQDSTAQPAPQWWVVMAAGCSSEPAAESHTKTLLQLFQGITPLEAATPLQPSCRYQLSERAPDRYHTPPTHHLCMEKHGPQRVDIRQGRVLFSIHG
jgi:hypothetical protein